MRTAIIPSACSWLTTAATRLACRRAKAAFPELEVLSNERNLGFAAACNRGLAAAHTRYAVLLNDDTHVEPNWARSPRRHGR